MSGFDTVIRHLRAVTAEAPNLAKSITVPKATRCAKCGYFSGGRFIQCPICKAKTPEFDAVVAQRASEAHQ